MHPPDTSTAQLQGVDPVAVPPRAAGMAALLFLVVMTLLAFYQNTPPAPLPEAAPPTAFSAARARKHQEAISQVPRPVGTEAHSAARTYILEQVKAAGLTPEIQTATALNSRWLAGSNVVNVMARLPGTSSTKAVLVVGHYDSVATGPGASDDAAAVASMLETLRALKAGPPLRNDVIFLFTDAEEIGLLGARAFVDEHPWAADVGLVLNLEARGTKGGATMFEISQGNGTLMREFAGAVPYPFATSLSYDVYKRMPNDTDITELKRIPGVAYLNVAYIEGGARYHTMLDNLEYASPASLQHMGSYTLGVARHFGNRPLPVERTEDAVWFNAVRWVLVRYPASWALPLALVAAVGLLGALLAGFRRKRLHGRGLLAGVAAPVAVVAVCVGVAWAAKRWILGATVRPDMVYLALAVTGVAVAAAVYHAGRRWAGLTGLLSGALLWWTLAAVATAVWLPGGSYLFVWPALFGLVGLGWLVWAGGERQLTWRTGAVLFLCTLPALMLLVPTVHLLFEAMGRWLPEAPMALLALLPGLLTVPLCTATGGGRWWLPGALVALGIGLGAAGAALPPSAAHPATTVLFYGLDADTGKAVWLSPDRKVNAYTEHFLGLAPNTLTETPFFRYSAKPMLEAAAPALDLPAPQVTVLDDQTAGGERVLRLRVTSPRRASTLVVQVGNQVDVRASQINGRPYGYRCEPGNGHCLPWKVSFSGVSVEGIELQLRVAAGQPFAMRVTDISDGLPPKPAAVRSPDLIPWYGPFYTPGDTTLVTRRFDL